MFASAAQADVKRLSVCSAFFSVSLMASDSDWGEDEWEHADSIQRAAYLANRDRAGLYSPLAFRASSSSAPKEEEVPKRVLAYNKFRCVYLRWQRVVGKLTVILYLRPLWGGLGNFLNLFRKLK
jgi:hypothetical protein